MTVWAEDGFTGSHLTLTHSHRNIGISLADVRSFEVVGKFFHSISMIPKGAHYNSGMGRDMDMHVGT